MCRRLILQAGRIQKFPVFRLIKLKFAASLPGRDFGFTCLDFSDIVNGLHKIFTFAGFADPYGSARIDASEMKDAVRFAQNKIDGIYLRNHEEHQAYQY